MELVTTKQAGIVRQFLRFFIERPQCGFPSPAADHEETNLDLHELLVKRPAATVIYRVSGTSMKRAGIHDGDLIICDRSVMPRPGHIVVATLNGDFIVKRLDRTEDGQVILVSEPDPDEGDDHPPLPISADAEFTVLGRVMSVVHFT